MFTELSENDLEYINGGIYILEEDKKFEEICYFD